MNNTEANRCGSCFSTDDYFSSISSLVFRGYKLLREDKRRALAVFLVMLKTVSLVLDVAGQSPFIIHLAAFLLSFSGFVMTILTCMPERIRGDAEKQLGALEIGFSVVLLIGTFLPVLGIKINNNYTAPVLLLVFAIIAAVFTFIEDENILGYLKHANEHELQLKEPPVTTAVLKLAHLCGGCTERIQKTLLKTEGVRRMTVDEEKELVIVEGTSTMDAKVLAETLKERLNKPVKIVPPKKEK
ncbi:uncharacterized protein LOC116112109 [Pistacia vera]|uniref:uncharacterized protein LOC116112109 n=1 Tax=Pistacia vera TaxID=55513 RepID=UPI001262B0CA|nr:uncharacterized protein LOC116112109 [Pistacia vera]